MFENVEIKLIKRKLMTVRQISLNCEDNQVFSASA